MIVAISAVSESGDHYLWCETGTAQEILKTVKEIEDFYYLEQIRVQPLQPCEYESANDLKKKIQSAIYSHWNNV